MSLRANDTLGFTKKPGVFSKIKLLGMPGTRSGTRLNFSGITEAVGNDIQPLGSVGFYTGFQLVSPGAYIFDLYGLSESASGVTAALTTSEDFASAFPSNELTIAYNISAPARLLPLNASFLAKGGEIVTLYVAANPDANTAGAISCTKIG